MYVDTQIFFNSMKMCTATLTGQVDSSNTVVKSFVDQWLSDIDCFVGLHDR